MRVMLRMRVFFTYFSDMGYQVYIILSDFNVISEGSMVINRQK